VNNQNERPSLLHQTITNKNHWMILKLIGTRANRNAIGAKVLVKATKIIMELLPKMRNLRLSSSLLQDCIEIHTQENEGDRIEQHALASLFENGQDPIYIIKWKDIYEELESATDRCEDVANVIEGIVLKNA